jgi:hypothetical protein
MKPSSTADADAFVAVAFVAGAAVATDQNTAKSQSGQRTLA